MVDLLSAFHSFNPLLSFLPCSFDEYADVMETWGDDDYDRTGAKPWINLSNAEKVRGCSPSPN